MTDITRHDVQSGLTSDEVSRRREQHGLNELPRGVRLTWWQVLSRQFTSLLVVILIIAAGIAYALGEKIDALAISLVVLLNAGLGFAQEWKVEKAVDALRAMLSPQAHVLRDGIETLVDARELVPGDIVIVEAGDSVPADMKLHAAIQLQADESALTGESVPVTKDSAGSELFAGTSVVSGRAEGLVTAIGANTSFGKIAGLTGSVVEKSTHLQTQLGLLARQLGGAALLIAAAILAAGIAFGRDTFEMFMTALSLAVAIVPEGLPAVVTITLALGAGAMVRQKALARRLQAVETLGAASVICTDKTGTLTENKMTATHIWMLGGACSVTGAGYDPTGHIARDGRRLRAVDDVQLTRLLDTAITCSHAKISHDGSGWRNVGEPTELALVVLAYKGWSQIPNTRDVLGEVPFNSDRKRMSVLARHADGVRLFTKGATEQVLAAVTSVSTDDKSRAITESDRAAILAAEADMAERGLRVIALASRPAKPGDLAEQELEFHGLVGIIDPPRREVKAAIAGAERAGIRVIMITGDSLVTAQAIAGQLGLTATEAIHGDTLEDMSDDALAAALQKNVLFARTKAGHKMRIVRALQQDNQIVAMTGDGVNDAPALKQADIGVSMGQRGTDVAKMASDLVLLDDNFATIVRAIAEGRRQFDNVRKFVRYLLSSNAGEVVAILANIMIGGPLIFLATQILWMNLVTDGLTAVALGLEKAEPDQMRQPPRKKSERILERGGFAMIVLFGSYTGAASLWVFYHLLPLGPDIARTAAFSAMVLFEKLSVFAFRSFNAPCWRIGWFGNPLLLLALSVTISLQVAAVYWPPLQQLLHTVPLGFELWGVILTLAAPLVVVPELVKTLIVWRKR